MHVAHMSSPRRTWLLTLPYGGYIGSPTGYACIAPSTSFLIELPSREIAEISQKIGSLPVIPAPWCGPIKVPGSSWPGSAASCGWRGYSLRMNLVRPAMGVLHANLPIVRDLP